jgi:hypothetical protein
LYKCTKMFLLLCLTAFGTFAQESEAEIKASADKLFDSEKYVEATSLYLRLLALSPRSYEYNYKYGTCLLFNSYKKQDAFKYLNYAVTDPSIDVQAYYFLGKAHHLNYQFNEAIRNYELYKQKAGSKINAAFDVNRQIEMCQNGKRLLTTITDLIVLEKKEIELANFFRIYDLRNIGGEIIVAANFQSKTDKKKNHLPLIHFPANTRKVFYASYGDDDSGNKDIYVRNKLPDGSWSLPQKVSGNLNTPFDEDFPYMHPNGKYLYFCSKGHNSMGGYDVFRSVYDEESNSFGAPENMDFAISSPDNDLMYVVDSLDQNAYFASSRQSTNGKIYVYKVRVERVPLQLAVVKGEFNSAINPANKKITIAITDFASGEKIGTYSTNEKGRYLITFPKGGKYTYEITVEGSPNKYNYLVSIPFLKEFKPLKQRISHEKLDESEVVKVVDLFNEEVEDPQAVLAEVIKMRSELNVNAQQFDLKALDAEKENQKILAQIGLENAGPGEVVAKFDDIANKQQQQVQANENLINGALNNAMENLARADKLQDEAKAIVAKSANEGDDKVKLEMLKEAQEKMQIAESLKEEVRDYMTFADSMQRVLPKEKEKQTILDQVAADVKKAVENNDMAKVVEIATSNTTVLKEASENTNDPIDPYLEKKKALASKNAATEKQLGEYKQSEQGLQKEIAQLKKDLDAAKPKNKEAIQSNIDRKEEELRLVVEEKGRLEKQLEQDKKSELAVEKQIAYLQNVTQVNNANKIAPNEIQARLSEVDTKNVGSLDAYIDQQVAELSMKVGDNGTQPVQNDDNDVAAMKQLLEDVKALNDEIAENQKQIDQNSALSPSEKLIQQNANDTKLLNEIKSSYAKVSEKLKADPNNQALLDAEKEILALENETEQGLKARQDKLAQTEAQRKPEDKITSEKVLEEVYPNYAEVKDKARQEDPKNQLQALNKLDNELLGKIEEELAETKALQAANPSSKTLQEKVAALNELKKNTESNIESRETALAKLNGGDPQQTEELVSAEQLVKNLMPNYETRMSNTASNDPKEKLKAQNEVDQQLIDILDDAIKDQEELVAGNPSYQKEKDKLNALQALKESKANDVKQREAQLVSSQVNPDLASKPTKEQVTNELMPDFESRLDNASNDKEKSEVRQEILAEVNKAIEKLETSGNPTPNESEKLKVLKELQAELQGSIQDPAIEEQEIIAAISPDYEANLKKIEASNDSPQEKRDAQLKEEQALLDGVNKELAKQETALSKDPENNTIKDKIEALQTIQAVQDAKVNELRDDQVAALKSTISETELQNKIAPEYEKAKTSANSDSEKAKVAEAELQEKLKEKQAANEKKLLNKFDPKVAAENEVIAELIDASQARAAQLDSIPGNVVATQEIVSLKDQLGEDYALVMEQTPRTENERDQAKSRIVEVKATVGQELKEAKAQNAAPEKIAALEEQLAALEEREKALDKIDLKEPIQPVVETDPKALTENEQALASFQKREAELNELAKNGTLQEQKLAQKELKDNQQEQAALKEKVASVNLAQITADNKEQENALKSSDDPLAKAVVAKAGTEDKGQKPTAEKVEEAFQQASLKEAVLNSSQAESTFRENQTVIQPKTELEKQKRRFLIEIGQLEAENQNPNIAADQKQRNTTLIAALKERVSQIEAMQTTLAAEQVKDVFAPALKDEVAYKTEQELAAQPSYKDLYTQKQAINADQANAENLRQELEKDRTALMQTSDPEEQASIKESIIARSKELAALNEQIKQKQTALEQAMNALPADQSTYKNLLARDVAPSKAGAPLALVNEVADGFKISPENPAQRNNQKIPVNLKAPSGLVYRVQVGAFAKPIREDLFKEFTPVTGEKLDNGITRYMAGYFGKRDKVLEAQQQIRALGYKDAFVVAYCDGVRITLAEARRLEETGACVAKDQQQLVMEVVENTIAALPADSVAKYKPVVKPSDYNKAPGAAPAAAVEERLGLFYTVQVGVYNKPVPSSQLKDISPLITKRLPNGQIRYSSGMYHSVDAARPKKTDAVQRGITDAFITAYYKGERISLEEAKRLLTTNGPIILEKDTTVVRATLPAEAIGDAAFAFLPQDGAKEGVQLLSKETFDALPEEKLRQLNAFGTFYYNQQTKRIQSIAYPSKGALPAAGRVGIDFDTIVQSTNFVDADEPSHWEVVSTWSNGKLTAAMADWLLRCGKPFEGKQEGNLLLVSFPTANQKEAMDLSQLFMRFGAASGKVVLVKNQE